MGNRLQSLPLTLIRTFAVRTVLHTWLNFLLLPPSDPLCCHFIAVFIYVLICCLVNYMGCVSPLMRCNQIIGLGCSCYCPYPAQLIHNFTRLIEMVVCLSKLSCPTLRRCMEEVGSSRNSTQDGPKMVFACHCQDIGPHPCPALPPGMLYPTTTVHCCCLPLLLTVACQLVSWLRMVCPCHLPAATASATLHSVYPA